MQQARCDPKREWDSVIIPVTKPRHEDLRIRNKRVMSFLDKSEAAIVGVKIVVGVQLAMYPPPIYLNPVSQILRSFFPLVPLWFHGTILVALALLHVWGVIQRSYLIRRLCIGLGVLLFLYIGWAAIVSGILVPGLLLVLLYTLFGVVNFASLMRAPTE